MTNFWQRVGFRVLLIAFGVLLSSSREDSRDTHRKGPLTRDLATRSTRWTATGVARWNGRPNGPHRRSNSVWTELSRARLHSVQTECPRTARQNKRAWQFPARPTC
jgi:hypothetical protein